MNREFTEEKLNSLPTEIKEALMSPEFGSKLDAIADKHGMHIDQVGELANEIAAVMFGEIKAGDFFDSIKKSLDLTDKEAEEVTRDVNEQIFLPLRSALQSPDTTPTPEPSHPLETPDEILKHIEDAGPALPAPDLTDHLLQNTVESKPIEEAPAAVTPPPAPTPPPKKTYSVDPYREPVN